METDIRDCQAFESVNPNCQVRPPDSRTVCSPRVSSFVRHRYASIQIKTTYLNSSRNQLLQSRIRPLRVTKVSCIGETGATGTLIRIIVLLFDSDPDHRENSLLHMFRERWPESRNFCKGIGMRRHKRWCPLRYIMRGAKIALA